MSLSPIEQLIQLRLLQAKESLEEANTLYRVELLRGTMNRAYYAYVLCNVGISNPETKNNIKT